MVLLKKVIVERPIHEPQAIDEDPRSLFMPVEVLRLQRRVEIRGGPDVLTGLSAETAVGRVQLPRFGFQAGADLAALRQEVVEPVALLPIRLDRTS